MPREMPARVWQCHSSANIGLAFPRILGEGRLCSVAGEMFSPTVVGHTDGVVCFTWVVASGTYNPGKPHTPVPHPLAIPYRCFKGGGCPLLVGHSG